MANYRISCSVQNIQPALIKAGLATQVKVTMPLNAYVYQRASNLPSDSTAISEG